MQPRELRGVGSLRIRTHLFQRRGDACSGNTPVLTKAMLCGIMKSRSSRCLVKRHRDIIALCVDNDAGREALRTDSLT